jgi:hypothetical protein
VFFLSIDRSTTILKGKSDKVKRKKSDVVVVQKNKKKGQKKDPNTTTATFTIVYYLPKLHFYKRIHETTQTTTVSWRREREIYRARERKSDKMRVATRWCAALKVVSRR